MASIDTNFLFGLKVEASSNASSGSSADPFATFEIPTGKLQGKHSPSDSQQQTKGKTKEVHAENQAQTTETEQTIQTEGKEQEPGKETEQQAERPTEQQKILRVADMPQEEPTVELTTPIVLLSQKHTEETEDNISDTEIPETVLKEVNISIIPQKEALINEQKAEVTKIEATTEENRPNLTEERSSGQVQIITEDKVKQEALPLRSDTKPEVSTETPTQSVEKKPESSIPVISKENTEVVIDKAHLSEEIAEKTGTQSEANEGVDRPAQIISKQTKETVQKETLAERPIVKDANTSPKAEPQETIVDKKLPQGPQKAPATPIKQQARIAGTPESLILSDPIKINTSEADAQMSVMPKKAEIKVNKAKTTNTEKVLIKDESAEPNTKEAKASFAVPQNNAKQHSTSHLNRASQQSLVAKELQGAGTNKGSSNEQNFNKGAEDTFKNAEPVNAAQRASSLSATTNTSRLADTSSNAATAEVVSTIMQHIERLRKSNKPALKVSLDLPNQEALTLHLNILGSKKINVRFETDSDSIRQTLEQSWSHLIDRALQAGIDLAQPKFSTTTKTTETVDPFKTGSSTLGFA